MSSVIYLMGPTATGKTDVAVKLLKQLPLEIISVDSALVYKGMDIGTAKPPKSVLAEAPHRLIDICDPAESYSAAQFRHDALDAIKEVEANGRIPVLVGGTGLYFRTLEQGITDLPQANPEIRKKLQKELEEFGLSALYDKLSVVDPESANRIGANDPQRIQRALEVYELSGQSLSEHFRSSRDSSLDRNIIKILLLPHDREQHREEVRQRFMKMLDMGLIKEVETLYKRDDLDASKPSMRMVGYRQVWNYLEGKISYKDMENHAIVATRQLAKRQMTWWRKEENCHIVNAQDKEKFQNVMDMLISEPSIAAHL